MYSILADNVLATPLVTGEPFTNSGKSATCFVPPLSLITVLISVSFAPLSSFVIVQVLLSPQTSVIVPLAAQSPPQGDAV